MGGWRGAVYVCDRPLEQFSLEALDRLNECVEKNLGTNHWATKIMQESKFNLCYKKDNMSDNIKAICADPTRVYEILKWRPARDCFMITGKEQPGKEEHLQQGEQEGGNA